MILLTSALLHESQPATPQASLPASRDVAEFLKLLHPSGVFEVRIPDTPDRRRGSYKKTASGYFNSPEAAAKEIAKWSTVEPKGVYVTISPVSPELIARALNRIEFGAKSTTLDGDVVRRRNLLIDIDPVRKAGTSATHSEMRSAVALARDIATWLAGRGWPEPIRMMSGNGAYLIYRIDLPNDGNSACLIESFIKSLARRFSSSTVDVDTSVFNPSRIAKIGGTIARKGDHVEGVEGIEDRPHRQSVYWPPASYDVVAESLIQAVVDDDEQASKAEPVGDLASTIPADSADSANVTSKLKRCRAYIDKIDDAVEGQHGHDKLLQACAEVARFGLPETEGLALVQEYNQRCKPPFDDKDLVRKLSEANKKVRAAGEFGKRLTEREPAAGAQASPNAAGAQASEAKADTGQPERLPVAVGEFLDKFPKKRRPLIQDTLRAGETMNVIGASKAGKSWLILTLAIAMATGLKWLGRSVAKGRVLMIDNELHPEELSSRIVEVMRAMGVDRESVGDRLEVLALRGQLVDVHCLARLVAQLKDRQYQLVTLDAFYRLLPEGTSENDNAQMTAIYNVLDALAGDLDCAVVLNHHASKGDQSGKAITDIGSGAGSISRAADTHLTIRPHELDGFAVLEGVCRSFKPIAPMSIRFDWPVWTVSDIEPRVKRPRGGVGPEKAASDQAEAKESVLGALAGGPLTAWHIRKATGMGKPRTDRAIESLTEEKKISTRVVRCEKTRADKTEFFISPAPAFAGSFD